VHHQIADGTPPAVRTRIDELLKVVAPATVSVFEQLKADPGKSGGDNLNVEIGKLRIIRTVGLSSEVFSGLPWKVLQLLKRRAANETATEMREHPDLIRYGLMGCFFYVRSTEVIDDIYRGRASLITSASSPLPTHVTGLLKRPRRGGNIARTGAARDVGTARRVTCSTLARSGPFYLS
jgi:hypothetical protein